MAVTSAPRGHVEIPDFCSYLELGMRKETGAILVISRSRSWKTQMAQELTSRTAMQLNEPRTQAFAESIASVLWAVALGHLRLEWEGSSFRQPTNQPTLCSFQCSKNLLRFLDVPRHSCKAVVESTVTSDNLRAQHATHSQHLPRSTRATASWLRLLGQRDAGSANAADPFGKIS